jgi:hypothetical protein
MLASAALLLTELLSPFHGLRPGVLAAAWTILACGGALWWRRSGRSWISFPKRTALTAPEIAIAVAILAIAACVGLTAALSPPNSADAMAYHLPRVVYWTQNRSVAFFPTPYLNQISQPPLAEYLTLHTYLLTGGDHFVNLLTFAAFLAGVIGVSALAAAMGVNRTGQALAALVCATLPNGILQASGAKPDWLLTFFLAAAVYFAVRREGAWMGLCVALALATKATAYLFAPPLLVAGWLWRGKPDRAATMRALACTALAVLVLDGPQYVRNFQLSGSPLGYDSAQGDGFFRWRNERLGWRATVSNALRHTSEQLGGRSQQWNQAVFQAVLDLHRNLGLDPQDPDTTFRWSHFAPPRNANHEADANNRWHLALLVLAMAAAALWRERRWLLYGAALLAAFLLFCFYLKWQPFMARLELPLFVLGAPLAAFLLERLRPRALAALICLVLVSGARLPAIENWTRPLKGPHSLFRTARNDNYFSDMSQWNNRDSYLEVVDATARTACPLVGIDSSENQLEYPFQVLLRERNRAVRFVHTGVTNNTRRYAPNPPPRPCVVLCLDCAGNAGKIELYRSFGPPRVVGRFLLFTGKTAEH